MNRDNDLLREVEAWEDSELSLRDKIINALCWILGWSILLGGGIWLMHWS